MYLLHLYRLSTTYSLDGVSVCFLYSRCYGTPWTSSRTHSFFNYCYYYYLHFNYYALLFANEFLKVGWSQHDVSLVGQQKCEVCIYIRFCVDFIPV